MKNCFIKIYEDEWDPVANVLKEQLGFTIVNMHQPFKSDFMTKGTLIRQELSNAGKLWKKRAEYTHSNLLICANYSALILLLMRKLHILQCNKILWFGIYIHNPDKLPLVKKVLHFVLPKDFPFKIVVFSRPEIALYSQAFALDAEKNFLYLPYGEWHKEGTAVEEVRDEGYYFSGGYANRDFVTLAKLFQDKPWKLVICASHANEEFLAYTKTHTLSANITVYWDVPTERFNELLAHAHALILYMKYNTGASGQIVVMHALEWGKLVITSYTDVLDEYVQNEKTGVVIRDKTEGALADVLQRVEDPQLAEHYHAIAAAGHQHYLDHYSYEAISRYLVERIRNE